MLPVDWLPYEVIGFVVFWLLALAGVYVGSLIGHALLVRFMTWVVNKLWEGKNPSKGETPDGWRRPAAFYAHVGLKLTKFERPIAWRWRTYKEKYVED